MISICRDEEGTSFFSPFVNIVTMNFQCKSVKHVIKACSLDVVPLFISVRSSAKRSSLRSCYFLSLNLQFSCEIIMQNTRLYSSNLCDCSFSPFKY